MISPPIRLVLEISAVCQLRCPQCWQGLRWIDRGAHHFMQMDLFDRIADEAKDFIRSTYLHNWGEPTLNPHLHEMIEKTKTFSAVDVTTHGLFLTEELADAIAACDSIGVSIDGIDQDTYQKYRVGGKLDDAFNGLRMLHQRAGNRVRWIFVVFKENEHQIPAAQFLADQLGITIEFKPPAFWDRDKMDASMPTAEIYRRFRVVNGKWELKADRLKCTEFWDTIYVLPNGDVTTCCHDGASEYVVGNVWEKSLLEIWHDEPYQRMRTRHSSRQLNEMCEKYCQMFERVSA